MYPCMHRKVPVSPVGQVTSRAAPDAETAVAHSKFDVEAAPDGGAANASGLHHGAVLTLSAPSGVGKKWPVATVPPPSV